jgi:Fe-S-cluster containining protein
MSRAAKKTWWEKDGIRFECQGSGNCCVSRGQYGYVYMTLFDRKRMAQSMKLTTTQFTRQYCAKTDGVYHLKDGKGPECLFLKNNKCSVYLGRPDQCRTWPFWPEVMNAKTWRLEVANFCPGIGKGKVYSPAEISAALEIQKASEHDLVHGR